jgi:hypothetical protein
MVLYIREDDKEYKMIVQSLERFLSEHATNGASKIEWYSEPSGRVTSPPEGFLTPAIATGQGTRLYLRPGHEACSAEFLNFSTP